MKSAANKSRRLRRSSDFQKIKEDGRLVSLHKCLAASFKGTDTGGVRFGFTVSRKVGGAVTRNRIKRLGRESFLLYFKSHPESPSENIDINLIFRPMPQGFYEELDLQKFFKIFEKTLLGVYQSIRKSRQAIHKLNDPSI